MTRDEVKRALPALQAFAEGKEFEVECCPGHWVVVSDYPISFTSIRPYRIKPDKAEPKEFWINPKSLEVHETSSYASAEMIHVREVID